MHQIHHDRMKNYDIIIVGAGAAGLMAATGAASNGRKTLVLEKMPRPGRKIMITGKGRCNFTNLKQWNEFSSHIHPKPNFLKPSFYNLSSEKLIDFLQNNGLETVVERGDRAFPASHLATDVVDTLVKSAENAGAAILCGKTVMEILHSGHCTEEDMPNVMSSGDGTSFILKCSDGSTYSCRKLIICTGGLSYPATGSTGDGYRFATSFGHSIRTLFPSLTAIVPANYKIIEKADDKAGRLIDGIGIFPPPGRGRERLGKWSSGPLQRAATVGRAGVNGSNCPSAYPKGHINRNTPLSDFGKSLCGNQLKNVSLSLIIDGNTAQEEFGDLDFTDGGMEGPTGFKVSRKCVNAIINGSRVTAILDLKPAVDIDDLKNRIMRTWDEICKDRRNASRQYKERFRILLGKLMPMSLIPAFVKAHPNIDHKTLAKALKSWKFDIAGYVGYERCVITAGGVSCEELTAKTLESRLIPGLYFAGEVLDLDADTGGYNLQTAFSTGYLAGISAAKSCGTIR